jgi:hypothetical protein
MKSFKPRNRKRKFLKHIGNVCLALISIGLMSSPISAAVDPSEAATEAIAAAEPSVKVAKEVLNGGLKVAQSKPVMIVATSIVCLASIPLAGVVASPGMCVACGILIAKTFG